MHTCAALIERPYDEGMGTAPLLSIDQAAELLGVSRRQVYVLIDAGEVASLHIGRRHLVPETALSEYVARQLAVVGAS